MNHYVHRSLQVNPVIKSVSHLRKQYLPGQEIYLGGQEDLRGFGDTEEARSRIRKYTVVKAFPHHVSCLSESGFRESFGYVEIERRRVKG